MTKLRADASIVMGTAMVLISIVNGAIFVMEFWWDFWFGHGELGLGYSIFIVFMYLLLALNGIYFFLVGMTHYQQVQAPKSDAVDS